MFDINDGIKAGRILRHITAASRRLRSWVGDAAYDDALKTDADDDARQENLELAEAHLAMHFAVLGINTALRPTGVVRTEKVEGDVTITYHSPNEVVTLQQAFLETAESIARPYMVDAAAVPPAPEVVEEEPQICTG
jgi:hypothetical protein